jgi:hypothetical protein
MGGFAARSHWPFGGLRSRLFGSELGGDGIRSGNGKGNKNGNRYRSCCDSNR